MRSLTIVKQFKQIQRKVYEYMYMQKSTIYDKVFIQWTFGHVIAMYHK